MDFLRPEAWEDALAIMAERPGVVPIQGGTSVMVGLNFDLNRPTALLDLNPVTELARWEQLADGTLRVGAGVPYARLISELGDRLPGLAQAARTVGSRQIRNRGTVGGNLGATTGDTHAPLLAAGAVIEVESSARGVRMIPAAEFYPSAQRSALAPDELIRAFHVSPASGPQYFSKIGTRNAMVAAICSFSIVLYPEERRVGTGLGSAAPTPRRALAAEDFLAAELDWDGELDNAVARRFGDLVSEAANPVDDVRGTADYRNHALAVIARRALTWAWQDHSINRRSAWTCV
ncbi:FAD binding domain-containing protein [Rhodococcus marinonascens]|uniref:FAD binding domain-containing protein n=1 Tax=Rhodococcus marinonascens TaxID=38311 RepID=UPI000932B4DA|nr:FAD binding domain-containing protein [Rhodococcus marinonascens]